MEISSEFIPNETVIGIISSSPSENLHGAVTNAADDMDLTIHNIALSDFSHAPNSQVKTIGRWIADKKINFLVSTSNHLRDPDHPEYTETGSIALKAAYWAAATVGHETVIYALHPDGSFPGNWKTKPESLKTYSRQKIGKNAILAAGQTVETEARVSVLSGNTV